MILAYAICLALVGLGLLAILVGGFHSEYVEGKRIAKEQAEWRARSERCIAIQLAARR